MNTEKKSRMGIWHKRTPLERRLIVLIAAILVLGLIAIIIVAVVNADDSCNTTSCVQSAAEILSYIDSTQNPCDDFYKFTCGNFLKTTYGNKDAEPMNKLITITKHQYKTLYEQPILPTDKKLFKAQKRFYQSCMNETAINEDGLDPIKQVIRKLGGWPVLEGNSWDDKNFDWKEVTYRLKDMGYYSEQFIRLLVVNDKNYTTRNILEIREPSIWPATKDEHKKAYEDFVVDIAVIFGAERSRAIYELRRMLEFQYYLTKIANETNTLHDNGSLPYNRTTIADLETVGFISWWDFINSLVYPDGQLYEDTEVIFAIQKYVSLLDMLFKRSSKRVQANYMVWSVIERSVYFLPRDVKERHANFSKFFGWREPEEPRYQLCAAFSTFMFPYSGEAIRNEKHSSSNKMNQIGELVDNIKLELAEMVTTINWMHEDDKKYAREKTLNISTLPNCPDDFFPEDAEVYDKLETDDVLSQFAAIIIIRRKMDYRGLHQLASRTNFLEYCERAKRFKAHYFSDFNQIMVPDQLAQQLFFDENGPQYKNYGALGTMIGGQLSRAFAKDIPKYGEKEEWWSDSTYEGYEKVTECITKQLNGNYTAVISKNVNDVAGKKAAYLAYLTWIGRNGDEKKLPGLDYNSKQLFWIFATVSSCKQPGDRDEFLAVGALRNIGDFGRDFGCPLGSNMNPSEKCDID